MRSGDVNDHFGDCVQGLVRTIARVIGTRGVSGTLVQEMPMKKKQCTMQPRQIKSPILRDEIRSRGGKRHTGSLKRSEHKIFQSCPHVAASQQPEMTAVTDRIQLDVPVSGPDPPWIVPAAPRPGAMPLERCSRSRQPGERLDHGSERHMRGPQQDSSGLGWQVRVVDDHRGRASRTPMADPQSLAHTGMFYAAVSR